ncbi:MAG: T9SS type A sorting domain-containing protein [Melioribacteraceae bacterium]|nr:T9SS type A sorting domain-containing protein [Melioribacteraceae bacterium]
MKLYKSILLFLVLCISLQAQSVSVSGKVISNRYPIPDVLITLIDNSDTTLQYSALTDNRGSYQIGVITSINKNENSVPSSFQLGQSYPNPFSSITAIPYGLEEEANIDVVIYDILGREVKTFNVGRKSAGIHQLSWDGKNTLGQRVANGIFFYRFIVNGESHVRKMIFNQNVINSLDLPTSFSSSADKYMQKKNGANSALGTEFTIRVTNSENTLPLIVENEIESVSIKNDTTINFDVTSVPTAAINFDSTHQIIRGFGAATPWYRPVGTDSEIQSAFGMGDNEIGLTILRLTLDPNSNNWAKWIPSAKKAYEMGAKIIAAPWYAPSEMIERVVNRNKIKQDMYGDYVDHLNNYIKFMADNGAPIYGVSIQNEPDISEDWTWWDPEDMLRFMRDFADSIDGALVMAPESFQFRKNISDPLLNDSAATANTDIICGHIYGGGLSRYPLAEEKGKEVWMTEYLMGDNNSGNNLPWAIALAKNINDVMKANMNAYVWWTMIRYYGPIGDGTSAANPEDPRETYPAKGEVTKKGFVLAQFAKFIRPGFIRVESRDYPVTSNIYSSAYMDPESSKMVLVLINTNESEVEQYIKINELGMGTFVTYTTSASKNCEKGDDFILADGVAKITLEPQSITTFVLE